MSSKRTFECFVCKNNGFPNVMVVLAGKDDHGRPIRKDPDDESDHVHKTKLAGSTGGGYQPRQAPQQVEQQQTQPQPQLSSYKQQNDARIAEMHEENRDDREKYRQLMAEDVAAKREIALAIIKLADAIRLRGFVISEGSEGSEGNE